MGSVVEPSASIAMVVGLGNPGFKYNWTRHNIGRFHAMLGSPTLQSKFEGQYVKCKIGERDVRLVWPLTFMNTSGRCVTQFMKFYRIEPQNVLVVCDDLSLPLGRLRLRKSGSSGGQMGLGDILRAAGTQDVPRLRVGIDPTPAHWETVDYVLSKFRSDEEASVKQALDRAIEAIRCWLGFGIQQAMNRFNVDPLQQQNKPKPKGPLDGEKSPESESQE
jgi:peptidyl-tRNA hydrolase, PTH1 family